MLSTFPKYARGRISPRCLWEKTTRERLAETPCTHEMNFGGANPDANPWLAAEAMGDIEVRSRIQAPRCPYLSLKCFGGLNRSVGISSSKKTSLATSLHGIRFSMFGWLMRQKLSPWAKGGVRESDEFQHGQRYSGKVLHSYNCGNYRHHHARRTATTYL